MQLSMKTLYMAAAGTALALLVSSGGRTDQEKSMIGKYYISAVSDTHPLLELNDGNMAVVRAIRPGELSFSVEGVWHVRNDSLVIDNVVSSIAIEDGDPALVGNVAEHLAWPIMHYDDTMLRIERGGVIYDYHRRME